MFINIPTAHRANIEVPYGELQKTVEWCDRNCTSDWRYMEDVNNQYGGYEFFFASERDYIAFLFWNK
jgi:hypothetical protein